MNLTKLREHAENYGLRETAEKAALLIRSKKIPIDGFSIRKTWEAFIGPVDDTLPLAMRAPGGLRGSVIEEVRSMAFQTITQAIIITKVLAAYNDAPSILDELVEPFSSNLRTEKVAAPSAIIGNVHAIPEGQEYPEVGLSDRATEAPEPDKRGLRIALTDETIRFDRTGSIHQTAGGVGRVLKYDREYYGIYTIADNAASYAFYPVVNGVGTRTAIFRSTAAGTAWYNKTVNLKTSNGLLTWQQIQAAWLLYGAMLDEGDRRINVVPKIVLVPNALLVTANYVVNSTQVEYQDSTNKINMWMGNPVEKMAGGLRIVTSPHLDGLSTSTWYLGDFKAQYAEQVIIPTEVKEIPGEPTRDIVTQFVARRKSRVTATDDKFVIQNTA